MINQDLVQRKVSLIQDDLAKLSEMSALSFDKVNKDFVKQAALERILERIISRAIDINGHILSALAAKDTSPPKDYKETFLKLAQLDIYSEDFAEEISKSIGMRNILIHEYNNIDHLKIYESIGDCLRDYHKYIDYILKFLKNRAN